jgi:hypothetical protein
MVSALAIPKQSWLPIMRPRLFFFYGSVRPGREGFSDPIPGIRSELRKSYAVPVA